LAAATTVPISLSRLEPFEYKIDDPPPNPQSLFIEAGEERFPFTVSASSSGWLSVNPTRGTVPQGVAIRADPQGLSPGSYVGSIRVDSADAPNTPQVLQVALNVRSGASFEVRPTTLSFHHQIGGEQPAPLRLLVAASAAVSFKALASEQWLTVTPDFGTAPATLTVAVNTAGLVSGTYRTTIVITVVGVTQGSQTVPVTVEVTPGPVLAAGPATLSFSASGGQDSPPQGITISNSGAGSLRWAAAAATSSGGNWLEVTPASGSGNATLQVLVRAASLEEGVYQGTITITAAGAANSPAAIRVTLAVGLPLLLSSEGVVNAASFARNLPVAVNEILSVFGENFVEPCALARGAPNPCPSAAGFPLPTQLGPTNVTVNGVAAPLLLVTPNQINLLLPFGLSGNTATLVVNRGRVSSTSIILPLAEQSIGVFSIVANGAGAGLIFHADGRLVSRDAPIEPDEILVIYATGLGAVSPPIPTGQPAPSSPLSETVTPAQVSFDGIRGVVLFSGAVPELAGLYQINVQAPSALVRRYPLVQVRSAVSISNEVSAGGPSLLDSSRRRATAGVDLPVTLTGFNLPRIALLRIGTEGIGASFLGGTVDSLTATIPGRLLRPGEVILTVVDPTAPDEAPSNPIRLIVDPAP